MAMLRLIRGDDPVSFLEIFAGFSKFRRLCFTWLLYVLAVIGGMLLLIVPGIILLVALWPAFLLVMEDDLAPVDSIKGSLGTHSRSQDGAFRPSRRDLCRADGRPTRLWRRPTRCRSDNPVCVDTRLPRDAQDARGGLTRVTARKRVNHEFYLDHRCVAPPGSWFCFVVRDQNLGDCTPFFRV